MRHSSKLYNPSCSCKYCVRKLKFAPIVELQNRKLAVEQLAEEMDVSNFNSTPIRVHTRTRRRPSQPSSGPSPEYLHWRESVLNRDGYKCVNCGSNERLEADHIKPQAIYPELKLNIQNGRTLCHACHVQTETYGSKVHRLTEVSVLD